MIRVFFNYSLYIVLVFIQVFFIDSFEFKIGLIFIPILINIFQNDSKQFLNNSFILLVASEFFRNSFVGIPLVFFLIINFIIDQFSRIWSKEVLFLLKFFVVFCLYNIYSFGIFEFSVLVNFLLIILIFMLRRVLKGGYIRFN